MKLFYQILKGILIGIANIIPGVSGGTMAVSMGIYDDIIFSITHLFKQFKKSVMTLLPYIIGAGAGIIGLAFVIQYLFVKYPLQTSMTFIGLILGGIPVMTGRLKGKKLGISNAIVFLVFFCLVIGLQVVGEGNGTDAVITVGALEIIKLFFMGVIASATMVIPGVSGSMILMLMGYYNPIIETITSFIKAFIHFDLPLLMHNFFILLPFGLGVIIGIFAIAKLIEILLEKYEALTFSAILGLVIASPIAILMGTNLAGINSVSIIMGVVTLIIGFYIALYLGKE